MDSEVKETGNKDQTGVSEGCENKQETSSVKDEPSLEDSFTEVAPDEFQQGQDLSLEVVSDSQQETGEDSIENGRNEKTEAVDPAETGADSNMDGRNSNMMKEQPEQERRPDPNDKESTKSLQGTPTTQPPSLEDFVILSEDQDGETTSKAIGVLPASGDTGVRDVKITIANDLQFLLVLNLLRNVARYLRITDKAMADNGSLLTKNQAALFDILKLCDTFSLVMQNFQSGANNILEKLKIAYLYLTDGFPDFAMTDIEAISKDVASMKGVVERMLNQLTSNRDRVHALLKDVTEYQERNLKKSTKFEQKNWKMPLPDHATVTPKAMPLHNSPDSSNGPQKRETKLSKSCEKLTAWLNLMFRSLTLEAVTKIFQHLGTSVKHTALRVFVFTAGILTKIKKLLETALVSFLDIVTGAFWKIYSVVKTILSAGLVLIARTLGHLVVTSVSLCLITYTWNIIFFIPNALRTLCLAYPIFLLNTGAANLMQSNAFYYTTLYIPYGITRALHLEGSVAYVVSKILLPVIQGLNSKIPRIPTGKYVAEWLLWSCRKGVCVQRESDAAEEDYQEMSSDDEPGDEELGSRPVSDSMSSRTLGTSKPAKNSSREEDDLLRLRRSVQRNLSDSEEDDAGSSKVRNQSEDPATHGSRQRSENSGMTARRVPVSTLWTWALGTAGHLYQTLVYNAIPALCASVVFCHVWTTTVCSAAIPVLQSAIISTVSSIIAASQSMIGGVPALSIVLKDAIQAVAICVCVYAVKLLFLVPKLITSVLLDYPIYILGTDATDLMRKRQYFLVLYIPNKLVTVLRLRGFVSVGVSWIRDLLVIVRDRIPALPTGDQVNGWFFVQPDVSKIDEEDASDEESVEEEEEALDEPTLRYQLILCLLNEAILPLDTISDIMARSKKLVDTWYKECKEIVEPSMGKSVNMAERLSEDDKRKYWSSAMFEREVVSYYRRWRALEVYASEHRRLLRELRGTVEAYYTENPYPREALKACWILAGEERNEKILEVVRRYQGSPTGRNEICN